MNKKVLTICLTIVLALVVICCASCADNAADKLREINTALMHDYSKIELNVNTYFDDVELDAKYVITKSDDITNIEYEVERLNQFGDNGEIPTEYVSTVTGTATFDGDAITSIDGETMDERVLLDVVDTSMSFRLSYFDKIKVSEKGMSALVTNPQGFLNDESLVCEGMTVNVVMAGSDISSIRINYKSDGAIITLDYTFTR